MLFKYHARDINGMKRNGEFEALDEQSAISSLQLEGLIIISIERIDHFEESAMDNTQQNKLGREMFRIIEIFKKRKILIFGTIIIVISFSGFLLNKSFVYEKEKIKQVKTGDATDSNQNYEMSFNERTAILIKEAENLLKLADQDKAFGELMFKDDLQTVVMKLKKDSNLEVIYPTYDGGVRARFKVNETITTLSPQFYQGGLYKVFLFGSKHDSTYCYECAEKDFYTFLDMIKEKYGQPDRISENTPIWLCGRKKIMVWGLGSLQARCVIYDIEIQNEISRQEEQQKQKDVSDKSKYF